MNIQQLFKRKVQTKELPHCIDTRADHMSKTEFIALLGDDALTAFRAGDMRAYNVVLDEIDCVENMTRAEFAFYCWQRASNAAYSFSAEPTSVQLSLF